MAGGYPFQPVDLSGSYIGDAAAMVVGTVASGVADDNSAPAKVAGVASAAAPGPVGEGVRQQLTFNLRGAARIVLMGANSNSEISGGVVSRAMPAAANRLGVNSAMLKFNGVSFDPVTKPNSAYRGISSTASVNAYVAKNGACECTRIIGFSTRATLCYLKLYNKSTTPNVAIDVPVLTIPIPPTAPFNIPLDEFYFSAGLSYAITVSPIDADATAIAAGDIVGLNIVFAA
ncbi:hypothetical protein [Sphingobium yanoikuyae]|uniref:hypothetical protein n=1 Tax=Sphingobium yanoikuyae TaxID=13690 RepID=UPI000847737E|nr:hypothetical protein [Sphingobium yanoikuyae]